MIGTISAGDHVVSVDSFEYSLCDIAPTILDYYIQRGFTEIHRIEGGTLNGSLKMTNMLRMPEAYAGGDLRTTSPLADVKRLV
jgi:hypothetical protein